MKLKLIALILSTLISFSSLAIADVKREELTIEISDKSYSDIYDAVWFNPNTGTIHKLTEPNEIPPVEGAVIWIQPNEPEFAVLPNIKNVTIYYAGTGETVFESANDYLHIGPLKAIERSVLESGKKPVFIINARKGKSVIIVEFSSKDSFIFRWKKI